MIVATGGGTALVTFIAYVLVVVPSAAVTTILIVLFPTARFMAADDEPLLTICAFTVIVDVISLAVGVSVIKDIALVTDTV